MFHHQQFLYGYTKASVFAASRLLYELSRTEFAVKPEHHEFLRNMMLKQYGFSYGNFMPASLQGKEGFSPKNWDHPVPLGAYCLMALAGTPDGKEPVDREMASVYRRMVADGDNLFFPAEVQQGADQRLAGLGIQAAPKVQGHWTISYGAGPSTAAPTGNSSSRATANTSTPGKRGPPSSPATSWDSVCASSPLRPCPS